MSQFFTLGGQSIWSFSFSIIPSNEYSGLISFTIDWFYLLSVQGTLKSLLQHHNSKASILRHSASFIVQFSHLHMTIGKTIALTRWICWQYAFFLICCLGGLPWWLRRLSVCLQCGRPRFDPWVGKFPGEGNGNPLQYYCLENPMDRGVW